METNISKTKKELSGVVVSSKQDKTVVVLVKRYTKHPKYGKFMTVSKKYQAHDPEKRFKEGDTVSIVACRPISKMKKFKVVY